MADTHTQCQLRSGSRTQVAWLSSKHARTGNVVVLKSSGETWVVGDIWGTRPSAEVLEHERDYLKQRDASDI